MRIMLARLWGTKVPASKESCKKLFAMRVEIAPPPMKHLIELVAQGPAGAEVRIRLTKHETHFLIEELREAHAQLNDIWEAQK